MTFLDDGQHAYGWTAIQIALTLHKRLFFGQ